jgi:hypothetical protein
MAMISIITPVLAKTAQQVQWLHETIASVHDQDYTDWEMIVVDDHSPADLDALKPAWPNVTWLDAKGQGVSAARNQAAQAARGELLLPLDADDKLAPGALGKFAAAWDKRGDAGIIYSDVVMFGQDYARVYLAAEYDFRTLLHATYMTVGCLHRKADHERIGGWRQDMTQGLEDWEYWIAMGEVGVCGQRVAEPLYWYRRHPTGRLAWLKANKELWVTSYQAMRQLHLDSYNGRYSSMCCGGRNTTKTVVQMAKSEKAIQAQAAAVPGDKLVQMVYRGPRKGDFMLVSGVTRTRYRVPGQGMFVEQADTGRQGIIASDVAWLRSVAQGKDFQVVEPPKPAPEMVAAPVEPVAQANPDSTAWTPATVESVPLPESTEEHSERRPRRTKAG